jgi:4-carboxymuconolactone decarboxylase
MAEFSDLFNRGIAIRKEVLGAAHVDASLRKATPFTADFQTFLTEMAWGSVWSRPGLDRKTRSMLTIALLAALGRHDELKLHIRATRNTGVSPEEVKEILLQTAIYAGIPAANSAFHEAELAYQQLGNEEKTP